MVGRIGLVWLVLMSGVAGAGRIGAVLEQGPLLVYAVALRGETDLFAHDLTTGFTVQLTDDAREERLLVAAPDGRDLAFVAGDSLVRLRWSTLETERIAAVPARPAYLTWTAPDTFVYTSLYDGGFRVHRLHAGETSTLFEASGRQLWPALSPDGRTLADAPGGTLRLIDLERGEVAPVDLPAGFYGWPAWSPDGRYLAYSHQAETDDQTQDVMLLDLFASGTWRFSQMPLPSYRVIWSPDGHHIAVTAGRNSTGVHLYLRDVRTGHTTRVVPDFGNRVSPLWSPDGRYIAGHDSQGGLFVIDLQTGNRRDLSARGGRVLSVVWG